jgi:hypothetical protein
LQPERNAKAELNRRSQACEVMTGTGIRVAKNWNADLRIGTLLIMEELVRAESEFGAPEIGLPSRSLGEGWSSIRLACPVFRFGRPACIFQHLCPKRWLAEP